MTPRTARTGLLVIALLAFAAAGFGVRAVWPSRSIPPPPPSPLGTADALQSAFVGVAERVRPAVVNIGTVQVSHSGRPPVIPGPFSDDPFFKDFFDQFFGRRGSGRQEEFRQPGLGSGVIIDKRGYVLTNYHVVRGADAVTVRLSSKQEYRGRIIGVDPKTDLAVVRFDADNELTVATLGNSDALRVGEWAIAIGNPFGLDQTVTVGVVSATGQGIGFAIPANMVKRVTGQLIDRGKVTRGWIGVSMQPLTRELAESLGVRDTRGAVVARVYPNSPAAAAGLAQNDVIVKFEGTPVDDYHHLQRLSADAEVGRTIKLEIVRNREHRNVELKIAEAPDSQAGASPR
jgi:serine protease Do